MEEEAQQEEEENNNKDDSSSDEDKENSEQLDNNDEPMLEEGTYKVDKLLDMRRRNNVTEYLVKWSGYNEDDSTWEPAKNITSAAISEFIKRRKRKLKEDVTTNKQSKKKQRQRQKEQQTQGNDGNKKSNKQITGLYISNTLTMYEVR